MPIRGTEGGKKSKYMRPGKRERAALRNLEFSGKADEVKAKAILSRLRDLRGKRLMGGAMGAVMEPKQEWRLGTHIPKQEVDGLEFDDHAFWDAGRGFALIGAATVAKVEGIIIATRRNQGGVLSLATDLAEWLAFFNICRVLPSEILAEVEYELGLSDDEVDDEADEIELAWD